MRSIIPKRMVGVEWWEWNGGSRMVGVGVELID